MKFVTAIMKKRPMKRKGWTCWIMDWPQASYKDMQATDWEVMRIPPHRTVTVPITRAKLRLVMLKAHRERKPGDDIHDFSFRVFHILGLPLELK